MNTTDQNSSQEGAPNQEVKKKPKKSRAKASKKPVRENYDWVPKPFKKLKGWSFAVDAIAKPKILEFMGKHLPQRIRYKSCNTLTPWGVVRWSLENGYYCQPDKQPRLVEGQVPLHWAHPWLPVTSRLYNLVIDKKVATIVEGDWADFLKEYYPRLQEDATNVDDLFSEFRRKRQATGPSLEELKAAMPPDEWEVIIGDKQLHPVAPTPAYNYKELEGAVWLFFEERFRINAPHDLKVELMSLSHFINDLEACIFDRAKDTPRGFLHAFRDVLNAYKANPSGKMIYRPRINIRGQKQT